MVISVDAAYRILGEAVLVPLAYAIAIALRDRVLRCAAGMDPWHYYLLRS